MALVRWEPFREMDSMHRRMHRFFDDYYGDQYADEDFGTCSCYPMVDIHETPDSYRIEAEMPGVNPDNIDIKLERNTFYLSGEKTAEKDIKDSTVHRTERFCGKFRRSFILPEPVNSEKVSASYKEGVLTVNIPKAEDAKPKKIKVTT